MIKTYLENKNNERLCGASHFLIILGICCKPMNEVTLLINIQVALHKWSMD